MIKIRFYAWSLGTLTALIADPDIYLYLIDLNDIYLYDLHNLSSAGIGILQYEVFPAKFKLSYDAVKQLFDLTLLDNTGRINLRNGTTIHRNFIRIYNDTDLIYTYFINFESIRYGSLYGPERSNTIEFTCFTLEGLVFKTLKLQLAPTNYLLLHLLASNKQNIVTTLTKMLDNGLQNGLNVYNPYYFITPTDSPNTFPSIIYTGSSVPNFTSSFIPGVDWILDVILPPQGALRTLTSYLTDNQQTGMETVYGDDYFNTYYVTTGSVYNNVLYNGLVMSNLFTNNDSLKSLMTNINGVDYRYSGKYGVLTVYRAFCLTTPGSQLYYTKMHVKWNYIEFNPMFPNNWNTSIIAASATATIPYTLDSNYPYPESSVLAYLDSPVLVDWINAQCLKYLRNILQGYPDVYDTVHYQSNPTYAYNSHTYTIPKVSNILDIIKYSSMYQGNNISLNVYTLLNDEHDIPTTLNPSNPNTIFAILPYNPALLLYVVIDLTDTVYNYMKVSTEQYPYNDTLIQPYYLRFRGTNLMVDFLPNFQTILDELELTFNTAETINDFLFMLNGIIVPNNEGNRLYLINKLRLSNIVDISNNDVYKFLKDNVLIDLKQLDNMGTGFNERSIRIGTLKQFYMNYVITHSTKVNIDILMLNNDLNLADTIRLNIDGIEYKYLITNIKKNFKNSTYLILGLGLK